MRVAFLALVAIWATPALAQTGGMTIDTQSGNWVAFRHTLDDIHTDLCAATSADGVLLLRADADSIEVRSIDKKWNLPPDTQGDITIKVGAYSATFHAQAFDNTALTATVKAEDLETLMDVMDKAASATMTFGSKTSKPLSLNGSTGVLNAFRACVNNSGFAKFAGTAGKASTPF